MALNQSNSNYTDIYSFKGSFDKIPLPPLTTFVGYLKKIDRSVLSEEQKILLNLAVPHFSDRLIFRSELDIIRSALYQPQKFDDSNKNNRSIPKHSSRRYSGKDDLPRGRYSTLAKSLDGKDDGTLRSELTTYKQTYWSGMISIEDSEHLELSRLPSGKLMNLLSGIKKSIILIFDNPKEIPNRLNALIKPRLFPHDFRLEDSNGNIRSIVFSIPYEIHQTLIDNVFDLRQKSAQQWLLENVTNGNIPILNKTNFKMGDFHSLLRYLVTPVFGGNMLTDYIGGFLRYIGASGLIFPSARSINGASYIDDKLMDWVGWNFVDYRGAQLNSNFYETDLKEHYEIPLLEYLSTIDFEEINGGWMRNSTIHKFEKINVEDSIVISNENAEQRFYREEDYWFYWKTVDLLNEDKFKSHLKRILTRFNFNCEVSDISPRMWQYILYEYIDNEEHFPELEDARGKYEPLGIYLIGEKLS